MSAGRTPASTSTRGRRVVACLDRAGLLAIPMALVLAAGSTAEAARADAVKAPRGTCDIAKASTAGNEVVGLRTSMRRVFRSPCGGFVAQLSSVPVRFRDARGRWQEIDNRLAADGDALRNRSNPVAVSLPRRMAGTVRLADGDHWLDFTPVGARGSALARGATAIYRRAFPGADLSYTATAAGLKEAIAIADASAPSVYSYRLELAPEMRARPTRDGRVLLLVGPGATACFASA